MQALMYMAFLTLVSTLSFNFFSLSTWGVIFFFPRGYNCTSSGKKMVTQMQVDKPAWTHQLVLSMGQLWNRESNPVDQLVCMCVAVTTLVHRGKGNRSRCQSSSYQFQWSKIGCCAQIFNQDNVICIFMAHAGDMYCSQTDSSLGGN